MCTEHPLLLQKKEGNVSTCPTTAGQTLGATWGCPCPTSPAGSLTELGWEGGGLTPSRPAPAMLSSWPFMQEERGAMRPLPGKGSGPLCTSTFSCCPVSSHLL